MAVTWPPPDLASCRRRLSPDCDATVTWLLPAALWKKLSNFLGLSTDGLQTQYFPRDTPGECHSWNVDAFFSLKGSLADQQSAAGQRNYSYFIPVRSRSA